MNPKTTFLLLLLSFNLTLLSAQPDCIAPPDTILFCDDVLAQQILENLDSVEWLNTYVGSPQAVAGGAAFQFNVYQNLNDCGVGTIARNFIAHGKEGKLIFVIS